MCPPPRSPALEANGCFMVQAPKGQPNTRLRCDYRARQRAPLGSRSKAPPVVLTPVAAGDGHRWPLQMTLRVEPNGSDPGLIADFARLSYNVRPSQGLSWLSPGSLPTSPAPDPMGLARFYREVFELDLPFEMGWIAFLSKDSTQKIELHAASEGGSGTELPMISIGVDNLDATEAAVRAAGGRSRVWPHDGGMGIASFLLPRSCGQSRECCRPLKRH